MNDAAPVIRRKKKKAALTPKQRNVRLAVAGGGLLLVALIYYGIQPIKGSVNFGICRTYVEQNATYPTEIKYISLLERGGEVRIEYLLVNEFGQYESKTINCQFRSDPQTGIALADVIINRQKEPPARIDRFNLGMPALLEYPMDLVSPGILPDDIKVFRSRW